MNASRRWESVVAAAIAYLNLLLTPLATQVTAFSQEQTPEKPQAVLLELPPGLQQHLFAVVLFTQRGPAPLLSVPAPLEQLNAGPTGEGGSKALAWRPGYRYLLVLIPPGLASPDVPTPKLGERGLVAVYHVPRVGFIGIYVLDSQNPEALRETASLYMPFIGPLDGSSSISYTIVWQGITYSIDIEPSELAELAKKLKPLKPMATIPLKPTAARELTTMHSTKYTTASTDPAGYTDRGNSCKLPTPDHPSRDWEQRRKPLELLMYGSLSLPVILTLLFLSRRR